MLNGLLRLIGIGVLAIVAIAAFFFVMHIVVRLVIFGALILGILWLVKSFKGGSRQRQ